MTDQNPWIWFGLAVGQIALVLIWILLSLAFLLLAITHDAKRDFCASIVRTTRRTSVPCQLSSSSASAIAP